MFLIKSGMGLFFLQAARLVAHNQDIESPESLWSQKNDALQNDKHLYHF